LARDVPGNTERKGRPLEEPCGTTTPGVQNVQPREGRQGCQTIPQGNSITRCKKCNPGGVSAEGDQTEGKRLAKRQNNLSSQMSGKVMKTEGELDRRRQKKKDGWGRTMGTTS